MTVDTTSRSIRTRATPGNGFADDESPDPGLAADHGFGLVGDGWTDPQGAAPKAARRVGRTSAAERDAAHPAAALLWSRMKGNSPARRQGIAAALFLVAVAIALTTPSIQVQHSGLLAGLAVLLLGGCLAVAITAVPQWTRWQNLVVALDFLSIEILRLATGGSQSIFGSLVIIPVIWVARSPGRRSVLYAAVGVAAVFLLPPLFSPPNASDTTWLVRGCFYILTNTVAAAIINELSRQARHQFHAARAKELAISQEIDRGAEVQQALLPKGASPLPGYEIAGRCVPAKAVGGDFYDWYSIPGGLGLTLGDVMGKGVGAGMIAATAHAVVRSARLDDDPVVALLRTDACLSDELVDVGSFTTMFHGRLRAEDGRLRYADAGHGLTLHVRADGSWERLSATDLPLGLGVDAHWETRELVLEEGDMLVSFSDGVLELWDGSLAAAEHVGSLAASSACAAELVDAVTRLAVRTTNPDDVTVLAVRRERSAS